MAISKTLTWVLAGGAVVALGGAVIWWLRRRRRSKLAAVKLEERPPTPEPDRKSSKEQIEAISSTIIQTVETIWPSPPSEPSTESSTTAAEVSAFLDQAAKQEQRQASRVADRQASAREPVVEVVAEQPSERPVESVATEAASEPVVAVATPAPVVLVPKRRRKRYPVGPGELIELRADQVPTDASFGSSRSDVEIRVVEQDASRALVALDGPAGEVNVALLTDGPKGRRPLTSWKFQIVDRKVA